MRRGVASYFLCVGVLLAFPLTQAAHPYVLDAQALSMGVALHGSSVMSASLHFLPTWRWPCQGPVVVEVTLDVPGGSRSETMEATLEYLAPPDVPFLVGDECLDGLRPGTAFQVKGDAIDLKGISANGLHYAVLAELAGNYRAHTVHFVVGGA